MSIPLLIAAFAFGGALGAAHFGSLWWSVVLMREGRTNLGRRGAGPPLRRAGGCARAHRAARRRALLAAPLGVIAARALLIRRYRGLA